MSANSTLANQNGPLSSKDYRQVCYVSICAPGLGSFDINSILAVSRLNNFRMAITGCLLYSGRHFAQVLEGKAEDVSYLLSRIVTDSRHHSLRIVVDRHRPRSYHDWSMGCLYHLDLDDEIARHLSNPSVSLGDGEALIEKIKVDTVLGSY